MFGAAVKAMTPYWLETQCKKWLQMLDDNPPDQTDGPPMLSNEEPKTGRAPLSYDPAFADLPTDMMFMHEAVFSENEKVNDIPLSYGAGYAMNFWEEDENIEYNRFRTKDRVDRYLDESKEGSQGTTKTSQGDREATYCNAY